MQKTFDVQGPTILFKNVKDSRFPLLSGAMYTQRRYVLGIGVQGGLRAARHKALHAMQNPIPPVRVASGPCQENVLMGKDIDLYQFPVPRWHELEGGRYIGTLGVVVTRDLLTDERNLGVDRQQLTGRDVTASVPHNKWG